MKDTHSDPLHVILEQHLLHFQDPEMDREKFILAVVKEYIHQLRKQGLVIPAPLERSAVEELYNQVNTLLVRKLFGFGASSSKRTARRASKRAAAKTPRKSSKNKTVENHQVPDRQSNDGE